MSVDYYPCEVCGEVLCDCGVRINWCENGHILCNDCGDETNDDGEITEELCPICNKSYISPEKLLDFALGMYLNMTHEEFKELYRHHKKNENKENEE